MQPNSLPNMSPNQLNHKINPAHRAQRDSTPSTKLPERESPPSRWTSQQPPSFAQNLSRYLDLLLSVELWFHLLCLCMMELYHIHLTKVRRVSRYQLCQTAAMRMKQSVNCSWGLKRGRMYRDARLFFCGRVLWKRFVLHLWGGDWKWIWNVKHKVEVLKWAE